MFGNYRALVVDNKDPKGNTGRIKIRVYGLHDEVKESALPWAQYADSTMMGSLLIPDIGTNVWVFFEAGELDQPVYFACAPAKPDVPSEANTNYPSNRVIKTNAGIIIQINDQNKTVKLNIDDISVLIDANENIIKTKAKDTECEINGNNSVVKVLSDKIQLGRDGDVEQSVLGKQLESWINNTLITWLNTHRHLSSKSGTPTSTPIARFQAGSAAPSGSVYSKKNTNQ